MGLDFCTDFISGVILLTNIPFSVAITVNICISPNIQFVIESLQFKTSSYFTMKLSQSTSKFNF
jgi:hypothetical protein